MTDAPQTRPSLILRLKDRNDSKAWDEFSQIYRPVIFRLARIKGMQDADADDLAQQVLASIARAIYGWTFDPARASFRTWLHRVAHNAILNALTRRRPDCGTGDSSIAESLNQIPDRDSVDSQTLVLEYRREIFRWAAIQVRPEFSEPTWQGFWQTAVEGRDVTEVAVSLTKNPGSIYAARSRVMNRLKQKIAEMDLDKSDSLSD